MPAYKVSRYSSKPDFVLAKTILKPPNGKARSQSALQKLEEESKELASPKARKTKKERNVDQLTEDEMIDKAEEVFVHMAEQISARKVESIRSIF